MRNESEWLIFLIGCRATASFVCGCSMIRLFADVEFEIEHQGSDPKDGELYLSRVKPGETLVEARRDTDVQIVRQT